MQTTKLPYEFLARWRNGQLVGAHVGWVYVIVDDNGVPLGESIAPVQPVAIGAGEGFPLTDLLQQTHIDALAAADAANAARDAALADKASAEVARDGIITERDAALTAQAGAEGERDAAIAARDAALTAQASAEGERDAAIAARDVALQQLAEQSPG